jgi:CheY-like chemotaxis protein
MRRTILLADDSVTIRKIVEFTFSDTDIRVDAVASGQEALERFHAVRPDLVLADVVMPGPSGYELCRAIKRSDRPVPVLLLAGTFEPFDAAEARACGSDGHVTKPFDSRHLVARVQELLERGVKPAAQETPVAAPPRDDLEAMFDDLAASEPIEPQRSEPGAHEETTAIPALSPADIDAIARLVVARLSERVLREIAWDVVPDLAEMIVRERIRQLEGEKRGPR